MVRLKYVKKVAKGDTVPRPLRLDLYRISFGVLLLQAREPCPRLARDTLIFETVNCRFQDKVRTGTIRVKLNGVLVSDVACDPKRPVRGPSGLQLHDQFSIVQFRNLWIREVK